MTTPGQTTPADPRPAEARPAAGSARREPGTVEVFFDYTCGFSNRAQHWLDALSEVSVVWRTFSLLEANRSDGGPSVFEREEHADNVSLIALAVHEAVRAAGGDLDRYRRAMFSAWHDEPGRLSTDDIIELGQAAGLQRFDHDAAFAAVAAEHLAGASLGVFGTPSLAFGDGGTAFVKLDTAPSPGRARPLWDSVHRLATDAAELREWQRTSAEG